MVLKFPVELITKWVNRYDSFIDTKVKIIDKYYSTLALSFYNKINNSTYYKSSDIPISTDTYTQIDHPITKQSTSYKDYPLINAIRGSLCRSKQKLCQ